MEQVKPTLVAFTLDFETGGLDCRNSACTQIAIHATRLDTFECIGTYNKYIYPYNKKELLSSKPKKKTLIPKSMFDEPSEELMEYNEKALEYSAISMDMLYNQGEKIEVVAQEVLAFIEEHTPKTPANMKPFLIGQNVEFDKGFFIQMMEYAGLTKEVAKKLRGNTDYYGNWQPLVLDTIVMGQLALCTQPTVNSYKLEIMCEHLGVELYDAHDADADVSATTNIVGVLSQRMRNANGATDIVDLSQSKVAKSRTHFRI